MTIIPNRLRYKRRPFAITNGESPGKLIVARMWRKELIHAVACALLAASAAAMSAAPAFVSKPCTMPRAEARLRCGTVDVPENRTVSGGRIISLNIIVVRSEKPAGSSAPMFYLEGGPGIGGTGGAEFYLGPGSIYAASRDVVLMDQRGTGASAPLRCRATAGRELWDDEYDPAAVDACRTSLEQHADLTQYSTENAAADLEDIRAALRYDKIDLGALSYGTELAQAYMKRYPSHVRAAVLAGFVPLNLRQPLFHAVNAQRVLDLLFYECTRDPSCNGKYPRLREEWQTVLHRFDAGPVAVTVKGRAIELRRGPFAEIVRNMLSVAASQRDLPRLIHAASDGDFGGFFAGPSGGAAPVAEGLYLSIVCSEAQPLIPNDPSPYTNGTFLGNYRIEQERAACAHWRRYTVPQSFYSPPDAGVPVLVLSGSMDHVAAPDWAWEFCRSTRGCTLVQFPEMGHGPFDLDRWTEGDCFDRVAAGFFADPLHIDASCVARMRPPTFN